jgi:hypothetical protein
VSGPSQQSTNTVIIPPGEGRKSYSPVALAWYVENLELEEEDTLKSVVGPSILRIKPEINVSVPLAPGSAATGAAELSPEEDFWSAFSSKSAGYTPFGFKSDRPHSIFFARFLNGSADTLFYRFGGQLYRFRGEKDEEDEVVQSGLTDLSRPRFPDQYVLINNQVIFSNGVDTALTISYDGTSEVLGYNKVPSAPILSGPSQPDAHEVNIFYPNSQGYSWPGRIGTPGDTLAGRKGSLLSGQWYYHFQYEDINGNLSEFSARSEPVSTKAAQAQPFRSYNSKTGKTVFETATSTTTDALNFNSDGSEIDDLTRRFLVRMSGDAPEHTVATHIYRTPDTQHVDNTPRFLVRVPGSKTFVYDDNLSDSELGSTWSEVVSVPIFRVACAHQGRLIIGNTIGEPGLVRRSEVNFPGTFLKDDFIYPDSGGAEITGLVSHNGVLIAFTETAMYAVGDDFTTPQPISLGIGCSAPRSIVARKDGTLMWLSRDGFYGMKQLGSIVRMSSPIDKSFKSEINFAVLNMAVATLDSNSGEYRCVVAKTGESENRLMFCFDGQYWRRQTLDLHFADITSTTDWRRHVYAIGSDPREKEVSVFGTAARQAEPQHYTVPLHRVFLLDHQTTDWFGPPRRIRYRSNWILSNESGLQPTNVRSLYVGLKDAWNGRAVVRIFKNGSWKPVQEMRDLLLVGVDDGSDVVTDTAGDAELGKSRVHDPRLFWRSVPVDLHNVSSWAFEIEIQGFPQPLAEIAYGSGILWEANNHDRLALLNAYKVVLPEMDTSDVITYAESLSSALYPPEYLESRASGIEFPWLELGRVRIAAFAFDTSIATKGTPLGRVARRKDR